MNNNLPEIQECFDKITKTLFTINPVLDFTQLSDELEKMCDLIHDRDFQDEDFDVWNMGECGYCDMVSLLVGVYWFYDITSGHDNMPEEGKRARQAVGRIYTPNMDVLEDEGAERDAYNYMLELFSKDMVKVK